MIKPTIGRVVLVHKGASDQAEPALITYVHNDSMINVGGFNAGGSAFAIQSLPLVQDADEETPIPYATWMPYQKQVASEQAAKVNK